MGVHISLDDLPKKTQYIIIDSTVANGTVNNFSVNLNLQSNVHLEDMTKVIGVRLVDFYFTQLIGNGGGGAVYARYVDLICPEIPKKAQLLDETMGQIFNRIPLEYSHTANGNNYYKDVHETDFLNSRAINYFNPISLKKLTFKVNERLSDGTYRPLLRTSPQDAFYMVLEITTIDHKEKPKDRDVQILQALHTLIVKIDELNKNVVRIPTQQEKEEEQKKKKYPFAYFLLILGFMIGLFVIYKNKKNQSE